MYRLGDAFVFLVIASLIWRAACRRFYAWRARPRLARLSRQHQHHYQRRGGGRGGR